MRIERIFILDENKKRRELNSEDDLVRCLSIEWRYNNTQQKFIADETKNQLFIPFLTPSRKEMVLFLKNFSDYGPPCNVIIINGDSTLRHHLCPPDLISDQYLDYENKVGKERALKSRYFVQPAIYNEGQEKSFALWIGFGIDWYEVRVIDLISGKFGKCLRAAKL
jgi:hypothetical protein